MSQRTGLGRHGRIEHAAGDPLDGLVNLFDIGIVLAVAFLIAGLGLTLGKARQRRQARPNGAHQTNGQAAGSSFTSPSSGAPALRGHGQPVGTVYRLSDGQLVFVRRR